MSRIMGKTTMGVSKNGMFTFEGIQPINVSTHYEKMSKSLQISEMDVDLKNTL
jgi:hypothetical protein